MIKREKFLNYFLSIGFVLFLMIFLSLMIIMSRFVLSEVTPIRAHVQNTKTLLEDIDEVKMYATQNIENKSTLDFSIGGPKIIAAKPAIFNDLGGDINQISYFNSKTEGNSVISITFNGEIGNEKGIYYFILPAEGMIKGDLIAYKLDGVTYTGKFLVIGPSEEVHIEDEKGDLMKINQKLLLGKVFYIQND